MIETRTLEQMVTDENRFRTTLIPLGFRHQGDHFFVKDGKRYDFSATSLGWIVDHIDLY